MPTYAAVGSPRATAPQEKPQPVTNTMSGDTVDPQLLGQEEYVVSDESKLVGSELIDLPAAAHELYVAEVVDDLYSQLPPGRVDYLALDRLSRILPNLLEAFAMRVGHSAQNQMHRDIMEFIHKFGLDITKSFKEICFDKEAISDTLSRNVNKMSSKKGIGSIDSKKDADSTGESVSIEGTWDGSHGSKTDEEIGMSGLLEFRAFLSESPAYRWCLATVHREFLLEPSHPNLMEGIGQGISNYLLSSSSISRKRAGAYQMMFLIDWNPLGFIVEQGYQDAPGRVIEFALTLTGSASNAQALTCAQYLRQTWPESGKQVIQLMKGVVGGAPDTEHSLILSDGTKLTAWVHESGLVIEANGTSSSIAETGEQLAWLGAALRSSPFESGLAFSTPNMRCTKVEASDSLWLEPRKSDNPDGFCRIHFEIDGGKEYDRQSEGQCWHNIFRNPVVAKGYPISKRPERNTGIEMSLSIMAALAQARRITTFGGKLFIKGFNTMLVPTRCVNDMVIWHMVFNNDGSNISYEDPRVSKIQGLYPRGISVFNLETARHVLGWCSNAENYTGATDANYDIRWSGLSRPKDHCDFARVSIHRGKLIAADTTVIMGKQHKAAHLHADDYMEQLRWISKKSVVLYDVETHRAWLVDGASALLHLTRMSLEYNKEDDFHDMFLFDSRQLEEAQLVHSGKLASISVLRSNSNRKMKIYAKSETTWNEDQASQSDRCINYFCFEDRVEQIHHILEQIFSHQTQLDIEKVITGRMKEKSDLLLEGFDFMDVATGEDQLWPRVTSLKPAATGWVSFARAVNSITLFGRDFGELIKPAEMNGLCNPWVEVPKGNDYLTISGSLVSDILKKKGNISTNPWRLVDDIIWHQPNIIFESCQCFNDDVETCDRVQVLLPSHCLTLWPEPLSSPTQLETSGAVIFGNSRKFHSALRELDDMKEISSIHPKGLKRSSYESEFGSRLYQSTDGLNGLQIRGSFSTWGNLGITIPSLIKPITASLNKAKVLHIGVTNRGPSQEIFSSLISDVGTRTNPIACQPIEPKPLDKDYTVGWICALKVELDAAQEMFDESFDRGFGHGTDNNLYILGRMSNHNVVLTCLPMGQYGSNTAAMVATRMMNKFPNIKVGLMVGIGGGLPSKRDDIRLGDVVVSMPNLGHGGVLQYDMGKYTADGFECTSFLRPPPETLLAVLNLMPSHGSPLGNRPASLYPGEHLDHLYKSLYEHIAGGTSNICTECDDKQLIVRGPGNRETSPYIFYGTIASGNSVIRDAVVRDMLIQRHTVLCVEMEASGLMNTSFPCLVIRGISDYADSHKNDTWKEYAAAAAAQYAKDFLCTTP